VQRGYDAGPQAFEGAQGFFNVYNGAGNYAPERVFEDGNGGLEIEGTSVGIKQFPCCGSTHAAITMALEVLRDIQRDMSADGKRQSGLDPSQVKQIRILPNGNRLAHTNKPWPGTALEAKFSVQHVVARALVSGNVRLDHFSEACVQDPAIHELLNKTEALPHPDMPLTGDHLWGAEVIVHLHSGAVFSRRIEDLTCRDGNYPMSDAELWEKFRDCAAVRLAPDSVKHLYEQLHDLKGVQDVGSVTALLAVRD
jgi:2-methylcitrate dehydratase PrpD